MGIIRFFINLYTWIVIADVVLSYMPQYQYQQWAKTIRTLAGYSLKPVRKILPPDLPFDFSPMIVLILLQLIPALW